VHDVTAIFNRFDTNTLSTCFSAYTNCINHVVSQSEHLQRVFCYERIYNCTVSWTSCMFRFVRLRLAWKLASTRLVERQPACRFALLINCCLERVGL